ncbi:hypothetical protein AMELA_G00269390, partial [Ameiurus melas]
FSSASNLISSALQDESSPPVSRKGSTVSQSSTPATSRKGSIVPTGEPKPPISKRVDDKPVDKKTEELFIKLTVTEKQEAMPEPVEVTTMPKSPSKASQPTCPLCKVDLNVGSEELPNYNTCTECKDMVCNLCGFNPMPHLGEGEWLCLHCQTQRALSVNLGDMGQIPRPFSTSGTESAGLHKDQSIKISEGVQVTETPQPTVLKPNTEEQIVASKIQSLESVATPPASIQTTDTTPIEASDKTDALKCIPTEPTVREEKLTTEELIQHVSSQEAAAIQIESETPPTEVVITTLELKSEIAQPMIRTKAEVDFPKIMQPPTVAASMEFTETCELTTMAAKLAEDAAFEDKLIQNEGSVIQLKITPTTPCEHEGIVLSLSGDKTNNLKVNDKKDPQGNNIFPVSAESYSSSEEELKEITRASESLWKETAAELAQIKGTVCIKHYSDSGDEAFIQTELKKTSTDKDLSLTYHQNYITKQIRQKDHQILNKVSDPDSGSIDHEAERNIKQLNVPEESADSCLLSQEDQIMHVSPIYKTVKTFILNDNEKEENTELKSTIAISVQQNVPVSQISEEESLAEDMSKDGGSSSRQVSHVTSGTTSPTSLSSLGEESDSSPCHKKDSLEGKQQRKVKHRQGQPLQIIADSSEEEKILEEGDQLIEQEIQRETDQRPFKKSYKKLHKEKDPFLDHPPNKHSQIECISQAEEVLQVSEINTYETFSYSKLSPRTETEQENVVSSRLPPMDLMHDVGEKQLKSADEAYEEMMQKAKELKAMTKKITPPDIEPLYGGMLIEDYVYESLVEEPAQAIAPDHNTTVDEYLTNLSVTETVRKLRTPEEAYEEMQKNRELMLKDQTIEHAYVNKPDTDTCYVNISEHENWQWYAETTNDELLNREKDIMTPGTSPTQSTPTPLSPVSPLSLSEPLYDSTEVIQIPSSGEEDNVKDEFTTEPIECTMEPYRAGSTSPQDQPFKNVLYPIPDLKITQCSSGEEEAEDESITREYEIVMLNGIAQCDEKSEGDSEFKEYSVEAQLIESEPTSVVSEVPLSKLPFEHVSLASAWDSQAPALSPPSTSLDLTSFSSCLIDQIAGQASIPPKNYVAESSTTLGSDSENSVIISVEDLVSKPALQHLVQPAPLIDISMEAIICPSQVAASNQQTIKVSTAPSLPGMSATQPPLEPKLILVSSPADVSESSVTPEPTHSPNTADVSMSKPPLSPKPVFTSKPTLDASIVKIQDRVSQPDLDLLSIHSETILEPTNIEDYSTLMLTSTVTSMSTQEQITVSVSSQAMSPTSVLATVSFITDSATAPAYVPQAPISCVASTPFVPDVLFPRSEWPVQVPTLDPTPGYSGREHTFPAIVPEPVPFIVEMPDLMPSPSKYPIPSTALISTLAHTPALTSTSTIDKGHISALNAVSTCCSTDTLSTVQSISVAPCVSSLSVEQSYFCSTISQSPKPSILVDSFIHHQHVSPTIHAADMTAMTPVIKIPISCIDADKSLVEATAAHELPAAVSQTFQSVEHAVTKVFPIINTTVDFVTLSSLPSQSIVVDTKPNTGNVQLAVHGSQIVTPALQTGQGTAIIVPSVENIHMIKQETQDIITNAPTSIQQARCPPVIVSVSTAISLDSFF